MKRYLKKGRSGKDVLEWQKAINKVPSNIRGPKVALNGYFGEKTLEATLKIQKFMFSDTRDHDGVVGPKTINAYKAQFPYSPYMTKQKTFDISNAISLVSTIKPLFKPKRKKIITPTPKKKSALPIMAAIAAAIYAKMNNLF